MDLSLDIEANTSISGCLRNFSATETLGGSDKFYCDTCCSLQEAQKCMKIKALPKVLALHLKRFKYIESAGRYKKLCHRVVFPLVRACIICCARSPTLPRKSASSCHYARGAMYPAPPPTQAGFDAAAMKVDVCTPWRVSAVEYTIRKTGTVSSSRTAKPIERSCLTPP